MRSNYNSTKLCFVYFEFYRGKDPRKRNAWIILYAVVPVAASLQNRHSVMRNQTNRKNKILWSDISRILFLCLSKKGGGSFLCLERDVRNGWPSPPKFSTESIFGGGRQQKDGPIRLDQQVSERRFTKDPGKGGSGPRRHRLATRHAERALAPQRGCDRLETSNQPIPGGA